MSPQAQGLATLRGTATYNAASAFSEGQLRGAMRSAEDRQQRVMARLKEQHPELLQG